MNTLRTLWFRIRAFLDRRRMDDEIAEEMHFHLEADVAERMRRGASESEARRAALTRFGGVTRLREDTRDAEGYAPMDALVQHIRYAVRGVRRAPVFVAMVTLTLGLGIGANGAMFGIIDRLLLRGPDGVVRPNELRRAYVTVRNDAGADNTDAIQPYALYTLLRSDTSVFAGAGAYMRSDIRVGRGADWRIIPAMAVTWDLFTVLGAKPYLGRFFDAKDDRPPQGARVVVVGYAYWLRDLGGDPHVLGRTIDIDTWGEHLTIIGVAPPHFTGPERAAVDLWIPSSVRPGNSPDWPTTWNATSVQFVGRLRRGVSERRADAHVTSTLRSGYTGDSPKMRRATVSLRPLSFDRYGNEPPELGVARVLYAVAILVLLLAAANVANLLIARATRRQREFGVRVALGAGRARLASMMLVESGMIALLGGLAGLALGYGGGELIRRTLLPSVAWPASPVDATVLAYTAVAVIVTTLLVGAAPAFHAVRGDPMTALKSGLAQSGERHERARTALQVAQVALSVVLLTTAGLFVRSLWRVRSLDLGFQPDAVLTASVAYDDENFRTHDAFARALTLDRTRSRQLLEQVRRLPGVAHAALDIGTPFTTSFGVGIRLPGHDSLPATKGGGPWISEVGPDYFETVGTRLLRGRTFNAGDHEGSPHVVIVNSTMAQTFWPNEDPLTQCLIVDEDACSPVVGIVADAHQWKLREDPALQFYIPYGQNDHIAGEMLLVQPRGDVDGFAGELRKALVRLVPNARLIEVRPLAAAIDPQVRPWRVGALMFGLFGVLALLVAAVGLFSVVSYLLAQRTKELGVRIALGARSSHVLRLTLGGSLLRAALGVAIGVLGAVAIGPFVQPYLFETMGRDPEVLGVVTLTLFITTLVASAVPSWRACRVDPIIALRLD